MIANKGREGSVFVNNLSRPSPAAAKEACMNVVDLSLASLDDQVVESPDMFLRHVPARYRAEAHSAAPFGSFRSIVKPLPLALQSGLPL